MELNGISPSWLLTDTPFRPLVDLTTREVFSQSSAYFTHLLFPIPELEFSEVLAPRVSRSDCPVALLVGHVFLVIDRPTDCQTSSSRTHSHSKTQLTSQRIAILSGISFSIPIFLMIGVMERRESKIPDLYPSKISSRAVLVSIRLGLRLMAALMALITNGLSGYSLAIAATVWSEKSKVTSLIARVASQESALTHRERDVDGRDPII